MIYYRNIEFRFEGKKFSIDVCNDITVIDGDSCTGKTLFVNALRAVVKK